MCVRVTCIDPRPYYVFMHMHVQNNGEKRGGKCLLCLCGSFTPEVICAFPVSIGHVLIIEYACMA
jgi:hypothetical protein